MSEEEEEEEEEDEEDCRLCFVCRILGTLHCSVHRHVKNIFKEKFVFDNELPKCTVSHPRRQHSFYSPPCESEVSDSDLSRLRA